MALDPELMHQLTHGTDKDAWEALIQETLQITSKPLIPASAPSEVIRRDREIGTLDHFLASTGWDLWHSFGNSVVRTSDRLVSWWSEPYVAKAALILDGLSLRELPWLLQGAQKYGFNVEELTAHASELPGKTNEFARALGFGSRSKLQNDKGGLSHKLQPATTECVDLPWKDCADLVNSTPNWLFWHQWPDNRVHDAVAGQGLDTLTRDAAKQLVSEEFWTFVERLATGRRLVITSDHGYAATGHFHDAEGDVGQFLKQTFASGRNVNGVGETGPFMPPVLLSLDGPHGPQRLAIGRRKWKSQGGYPSLTHGGLTLLEVLSPFLVLTK